MEISHPSQQLDEHTFWAWPRSHTCTSDTHVSTHSSTRPLSGSLTSIERCIQILENLKVENSTNEL